MGATPEYVHLHNHTEYSRQDGLQRMGPMVAAAAADGQRAIAITDHGSLAGVPALTKATEDQDVKPIFGMEAYLAVGSRREKNTLKGDLDDGSEADEDSRDGKKERKYHHLTILAASAEGWKNLVRINNDAANHFFHKPRTDLEALTQFNKDLILGSGCLGGPVASRFLSGDDEGAYAALESLLAVVEWDKDRLFVEIMSHGIPEEDALVTPKLIEAAHHFGLRLVASNDAHYTSGCDHDGPAIEHVGHGCDTEAHDLLLALGTNAERDDPTRYRFNGHGYHLRTAAEMDAIFSKLPGAQDAVRNSLAIAEMVDANVLPEFRYHLPKYPVPDQDVAEYERLRAAGNRTYTSPSHLHYVKKLTEGARRRYGWPLPQEVRDALNWEVKVIDGAGMVDYMLIHGGITEWARDTGIGTGPARGSAGGSTAAYCNGSTDIEPLENGLLFERFLDPTRVGMPDIDSDFEKQRRPEVLKHIEETYGADRVALIGTRGTYKTKGALRNVGRLTKRTALSVALAEQVWGKGGKDATFAQLLDPEVTESIGFQQVMATDPDAEALVSLASTIEGTRSGVGIHACGVLVCDEPLLDQVPMRRDTSSGMWVTEWEGPELESMGYLKLDILGLRTLDVISTTLDMMRESGIEIPDITYRGIEIDPSLPRARAAWDLVGAGDTEGVFQLASDGMRKLAQQVQPQSLNDISALVALYRPGPMGAGMHEKYGDRKHGREPVSYDYLTTDPDEQAVIASVLDDTLGLIVYQESVMELSGVVAGFGPGDKNKLRKAFSKKKREEMEALREKFIAGATSVTEDGADSTASIAFREATARELWRTFDASAEYLFNKSHSAAYGFVGYITAYLKANWPSHFGAATLATTKDDAKRADILGSLRRQGIEVRPPSVTDGKVSTWVADDGAVVLGLSEVDGVGENAAAIVAEREAGGPFTSLSDLVNRVKITTTKPSQDKHEVRSASTKVCHRCLGIDADDATAEDDLTIFGACTCSLAQRNPDPDADPVVRTWTEDDGARAEVKAVKAGKNYKLRLTRWTPVVDEAGNPVMVESNLSLGIVESLIRAGACDAFGPRLGQLAVVRGLREVPDLPVPQLESGVIEKERVAAAKLGVTIGKGPFGYPELGRAILDWDEPDPERQANRVGVHRVNRPGWYLIGGVLDRFAFRYDRKGRKMANFTLADSRGSMSGALWESGVAALDEAGVSPQKGDVVVLSAQARDRTFKRAVTTEDGALDTDTGEALEQVYEEVTVRELSGEQMWVFPEDVGAQDELASGPDLPLPRIAGGGGTRGSGRVPVTSGTALLDASDLEGLTTTPAPPRVVSFQDGYVSWEPFKDMFPSVSRNEAILMSDRVWAAIQSRPGKGSRAHDFEVELDETPGQPYGPLALRVQYSP